MKEVWKNIVGYEGLYKISNQGRIKSVRFKTHKILKPNGAYKHIVLRKDKTSKQYYIHRLVWESFNGPIPESMVINHKDENPENNNLGNLMLCSQSENLRWGNAQEKRVGCTKWVIKLSKDNEILHFYKSATEAARDNGLNQSDIWNCCNNTPHHLTSGGYIWKYAE